MLSCISNFRNTNGGIEDGKKNKSKSTLGSTSSIPSISLFRRAFNTIYRGCGSNDELKKMCFSPARASSATNQVTPKYLHDEGEVVNGVEFKQVVSVESCDVGNDGCLTIRALQKKLQDVAVCHAEKVGIACDGLGRTQKMLDKELVWVIIKLMIEIIHYPIENDKLVIHTLIGSDALGMRRDWEISNADTGVVYAKATSKVVTMDKNTRTASRRMPVEVNEEIKRFYSKNRVFEEGITKCGMVDEKANFIKSGLGAKNDDIDENGHVNNSKYADWIFEAVPNKIFDAWQLSTITMEFRMECHEFDKIQSLCSLDEVKSNQDGDKDKKYLKLNAADVLHKLSMDEESISLTHRLEAIRDGAFEVVTKAKTIWKKNKKWEQKCNLPCGEKEKG